MTAHQRFFGMLTPGFILVGFFFGLIPMLWLFAPAWAVLKCHENHWTLWQFTWRATLGTLVVSVACMLLFGG